MKQKIMERKGFGIVGCFYGENNEWQTNCIETWMLVPTLNQ